MRILIVVFCIALASCDETHQLVDEVEDISVSANLTSPELVPEDTGVSAKISESKRAIEEHENEIKEEVKAELDKAVESLKESAKEKHEGAHGVIAGVAETLEPCGAVDCNNRGTCLGTKKTFICACQLGYSGTNCEETVCDSSRDCNGRGLCLGTTNQLTCLCNLGYTGRRCETPI
ncbi:unnamed protein product [Caenorhabditis angaria]|uniref:EGF-like domain-containing protein n=1 Tax=Caenorhabditis angaria TaxID=860376 RepID=A0A9P1IL46_9PELO|nr:unnamed protein product [Caenorhabditis angaria]